MPNVYTRTGDKGLTGLFGGSRVPKQAASVEAYGTVDESNAAIGAAKALLQDEYRPIVHGIQQRLFVLAAELASDEKGKTILDGKISQADVEDLEGLIDKCLAISGVQRNFVVPGREPISAALHQARTVVRRAERRVLTMAQAEPVREELIRYLNRLSDALFAVARVQETFHDREQIARIVADAVAKVTGTVQQPAKRVALDLATAKCLAEAAEFKGTQLGIPIVFAAVDEGGNLILVHRMADSLLASIDVAINKAFTAAALKTSTGNLLEAAGPTGPLYGIEASNRGRLILFGGGEPVFDGGVLLGGVGISGGTVEEDVEILDYAISTIFGSGK
ncbi:MAG: cob(I)yrinic acid a,c-diamide adenosyltransferase [Propionibacteriaceae bacterium]|jgi:ATP:cob(I)alamin adenosyltransferase|nr:cob(I)yrinic acid a,c-diamide adenosyltransferase [Propionibacteriaceae bacterium]